MSQPHHAPSHPYPLPGDVLDGKYRIEHLLGEGGMGAVAKATHMLRRAPVALKFMSPAVLAIQGSVERFVNEGVAASQIDSDHVVRVFDVGRMPSGAPYLVMEYLEGCDLGQLLVREGGRLEPTRVVHFGLQILRALQTAHASGIIHRDMKPSNCFVIDKDAEPDFVKLVDFGISKVRSDDTEGRAANLTRTNSALGTPLYMSPEQARSPRDVDHRADLYSVGAMLYELLTGRTPYTAESGEYTEILFKLFTTEPEPLRSRRPEVSGGLAAVVHHALVREPSLRFSSASEMAEALVPFADGRSAQVITRIRSGRGRSGLPPLPSHGPGLAEGASAPGVWANPFPAAGNVAEPGPLTDVGVSRTPPLAQPAATTRRTPRLVALAVLLVLCAVGGLVAAARRSAIVTLPAARAPVGAGIGVPGGPAEREHSVPAYPPTMADPTATLAPLASAATLPPAAAPSSNVAATGPAPTASSKVHVPQSLNGVQPHF